MRVADLDRWLDEHIAVSSGIYFVLLGTVVGLTNAYVIGVSALDSALTAVTVGAVIAVGSAGVLVARRKRQKPKP